MNHTAELINSDGVSPDVLVAMTAGLPAPVAPGRHARPGDEGCLMELASALAREPWSDHPACVHPVLAAVARAVNDRVGDTAREWLAPLVPPMIGTADLGPDGRPRPERCARLVLLCTQTALRLSPFMAAEMESARLTALSVLARHGPATPATTASGRAAGTAVRRRTVALLDRFGLLTRVYPRQAAVEAAQAVSVIAGAATGPAGPTGPPTQRAAHRDAQLGQVLRACVVVCAGGTGDRPRGDQAAAVGGQMHQHGPGQAARTCPQP
jgi:hypothetical protein